MHHLLSQFWGQEHDMQQDRNGEKQDLEQQYYKTDYYREFQKHTFAQHSFLAATRPFFVPKTQP